MEKPSITYQRKVACGNIYAVFVEHHNGNFKEMLLFGDMLKQSPCGSSVLGALQKMITFALRRAFKEGGDAMDRGILKHLFNPFPCNKYFAGVPDKSCSDAIAKMVKEYLQYVQEREKKSETEITETATETTTEATTNRASMGEAVKDTATTPV